MLSRLLLDRHARAFAILLLLPRLVLPVGSLSLVSSCSALGSPTVVRERVERDTVRTAEDVASQTQVNVDSFKGTTLIRGPLFHAEDPAFGRRYNINWNLWTRPGDGMCYLSFSDWRSDWAFFDSAADAQGRAFEVTPIDTRIISGNFVEESLRITMPRAYFEAHASSGTTIKVWGRRGEEVFEVPGFYITGFLKAAAAAAK